MGGFSNAATTTRTTTQRTFSILTLFLAGAAMALAHDEAQQFPDDLGLPASNVAKANISQEEYAAKMSLYLTTLRSASHQAQDIPQLLTYESENKSWRRRRDESVRLHFRVTPMPEAIVQSAEVRLLLPAHPRRNATHVRVYEILGPRRRRLLAKKTVHHVARDRPKWSDFDVTRAARDWLAGGARRNLGLFLECEHGCKVDELAPARAALNVLAVVVGASGARVERGARYEDEDGGGATDCDVVNASPPDGDRKPRCCRHPMTVNFRKLNMDELIIHPKEYEVGYCKGRCPFNFNYATNHSRIQNLVHRQDKRAVPRTCCAPSKLKPMDMLMIDPNDSTKLTVHKWDNMVVVECACS